jgi:tripartite-type tricarboxylate transporter receptor subunit TctC
MPSNVLWACLHWSNTIMCKLGAIFAATVAVAAAGSTACVFALAAREAAAAEVLDGKTVRIIVANPAGGPADLLARLLADQIGRGQGPTMVVENRPGASTAIGTEAVFRAAPDGTTLLLTSDALIITKHIRPALAYDPIKSFEPMCRLVQVPLVIVVNSLSPYRSLSDLLEAARIRPSAITVGAFGPAAPNHIAEVSLRRLAQVDWTYVPFPGDAPAVTTLLGEHVTALLAAYSGVMEQVTSGKFRVLAATGRQRIAALPAVPTVAEYEGSSSVPASRLKDFDATAWLGLLAPAGTPQDTIRYLNGIFVTALQTPEVTSKLIQQGLYPDGTCGAAFAARLKTDYEYYGRVISEENIKAE